MCDPRCESRLQCSPVLQQVIHPIYLLGNTRKRSDCRKDKSPLQLPHHSYAKHRAPASDASYRYFTADFNFFACDCFTDLPQSFNTALVHRSKQNRLSQRAPHRKVQPSLPSLVQHRHHHLLILLLVHRTRRVHEAFQCRETQCMA